MSEENTVDTESETPEVSPAENFIDAITSKDYVAASKEFEEMMLSKIDTSMEQEKINLAGQIFNGETPPEDEDEEEEDHIENDYDEEEDLDDDAEEDSEKWDEDESNKRIDIIGQNGNDGLHYDQEDEEDESEYDEEEEDLDDEEEVEK
tara:strand:- start:5511 stop:5957 length:447 start_codon:yes stop_codon:yes gene_type:complete